MYCKASEISERVIAEIRKSVNEKDNTLRAETVKYRSKLADAETRQERKQERTEANKQQIKEFVSNIMNWNAVEPKENQQRALGAAILTGSMAEYAMTSLDAGKRDKMFQMTKEQFEQQVTKLVESDKFKTYYAGLNQEQLAKDLAGTKDINTYFEDFKKSTVAPKPEQQPQQEQVKTNEKDNVAGPNL